MKNIIALFFVLCFSNLLTISPAFGFQILMFGDSITQGLQRNSSLVIYGITSPVNGARVNGSYGPGLENLLSQIETSYAYNWGYGGEKTSTGVSRINQVLASRKADYILILEGANDLINGISMSSTVANLGIMIDKSINSGITPIISEITPLSCPRVCSGESAAAALNDMVIQLSSDKHTVLSEIHTTISAGWTTVPYTSGDGIHINNTGYWLMANAWYKAISKALDDDIIPFIAPLLFE